MGYFERFGSVEQLLTHDRLTTRSLALMLLAWSGLGSARTMDGARRVRRMKDFIVAVVRRGVFGCV